MEQEQQNSTEQIQPQTTRPSLFDVHKVESELAYDGHGNAIYTFSLGPKNELFEDELPNTHKFNITNTTSDHFKIDLFTIVQSSLIGGLAQELYYAPQAYYNHFIRTPKVQQRLCQKLAQTANVIDTTTFKTHTLEDITQKVKNKLEQYQESPEDEHKLKDMEELAELINEYDQVCQRSQRSFSQTLNSLVGTAISLFLGAAILQPLDKGDITATTLKITPTSQIEYTCTDAEIDSDYSHRTISITGKSSKAFDNNFVLSSIGLLPSLLYAKRSDEYNLTTTQNVPITCTYQSPYGNVEVKINGEIEPGFTYLEENETQAITNRYQQTLIEQTNTQLREKSKNLIEEFSSKQE